MKIQSLVGPLFPDLRRPLRADDSPLTLEEWDSLRQVEIVLAVEEAFGIALTTGEIKALRSIEALVTILRRRDLPVEL